jgi:inner membrane protease subunit 1
MPSPWSFFNRSSANKSAPGFLDPQQWARTYLPNPPFEHLLTNIGTFLTVGKIYLFGHVFASYVGCVGSTTGISMIPSIPHSYRGHPWILYSSLHRRGRNIRVGDVIVYTHPIFPNEQGCKRVIGMPGDFVSVVTPGRTNDDTDAADVDDKWASVKEQMVRVPEGHCWVAGDNLEWSRDSRLYGPLPLGLVRSKVLAVVGPWSEAKWLGADVDVGNPKGEEREWVLKK